MYRTTIRVNDQITSRYNSNTKSEAMVAAQADLGSFDTYALSFRSFDSGLFRIEAINSLHDAPVAVATVVKVAV